jgi:hypothetical protein
MISAIDPSGTSLLPSEISALRARPDDATHFTRIRRCAALGVGHCHAKSLGMLWQT